MCLMKFAYRSDIKNLGTSTNKSEKNKYTKYIIKLYSI